MMAAPFNYLAPLGPKQLRRQVRGQLQPYLDSGQRAISGYTDALVRALQPAAGQTQANYLRAQQQQAAVDESLANRLSGQGQSTQNDLASQLAQAGQPTAPAQAVGQIGAGASNAGFASGSASLSQLLSQGAAAQQYAGQLPNIARLGGLQQQGQYRQQVLSQLPQLLKDAQAQEFQKAIAVQSGLVSQAKMQQQSDYQGARLKQGQQRLRQQSSQFNQSLSLRRQLAQATAQRAGSSYNEGLSRAAGHAVDSRGRAILNPSTGRPYKYVPKQSGTGGLSSSAFSKMQGNAIEAVKALKHGIPNPSYDPSSSNFHNGISDKQQWKQKPGQYTPQRAFKYLRLHGVKAQIADWAVGHVYGKWK